MLIIKDYQNCIIEEEVLIIIQENRGEISLAQRVDMDEAKYLALGESIFLKFLYQELRLENIL